MNSLVALAEMGSHGLDLGRVDMSDVYASVSGEVGQQTVGTAVNVVSGENGLPWLDQSQDGVKACHAGRQRKRLRSAIQSGQVGFCHQPGINREEVC